MCNKRATHQRGSALWIEKWAAKNQIKLILWLFVRSDGVGLLPRKALNEMCRTEEGAGAGWGVELVGHNWENRFRQRKTSAQFLAKACCRHRKNRCQQALDAAVRASSIAQNGSAAESNYERNWRRNYAVSVHAGCGAFYNACGIPCTKHFIRRAPNERANTSLVGYFPRPNTPFQHDIIVARLLALSRSRAHTHIPLARSLRLGN